MPKGSEVMTVFKKLLDCGEIWFVEVDAEDTYIHTYIQSLFLFYIRYWDETGHPKCVSSIVHNILFGLKLVNELKIYNAQQCFLG